jgi:hypothetical protein
MPLQRFARGGLIAAVVFLVHGCATGVEEGRDGFEPLGDAGADTSALPSTDASKSPDDDAGGVGACDGKVAPIHTFATGVAIPPKSFFVLGRTEFKGKKDVTVTGGSMAGDNGQVGLEDDTGTLVDAVGYGTSPGAYVETAPAQSPPAGGSISRRSDGADTDNNAADFARTALHSAGAPNP